MISEPEMVGEFGAVGMGEVVGDFDRKPTREPRPRRPWWWALSGAVVASAVWAGALYLYPVGDRKPDMHGYRLNGDPCPTVRLKALGAAIAPKEATPGIESELLSDPALDRVKCLFSFRSPAAKKSIRSRWHIEYSVGITVALHKRSDPAAEFEAMRGLTDSGVDADVKVEEVPNLGDSAYALTQDDGNAELRVLEGGAVLSLSLPAYTQYNSDRGEPPSDDGPDASDLSPYQSAMISDMRDLMKSLKR
ncbi:hypothetical protein OG978_04625 [Streptomyces sp. NBC_01591]|uniref:hypothetical protein n=1 Tax=Streptomyces sp. NBC_01591 TaxID=2975888 RepID=UPI002DD96923|nr:hypothetical protein [Streptomyces sp. NBC_01591]WSD66729.1 hypothetical protein OG978_04625 [Streptomyces sp. NBC_01591]